ncbi:MAG: FAD:protein FMN transferase [Clostridiales bacterium]|nr:FAD:protein FMN transferase [Clostridiales bacterium]
MKRRIVLIVLAVCLAAGGALYWATRAEPRYEKYSTTFFSFDTVISIIGYAPDLNTFENVTKKAEERFMELHCLYDKYNAYEGVVNLYTVNTMAASRPVKVPDDLYDLIKYSHDMVPVTKDTVNIALGPVLLLWHDAREAAIANPAAAYLPGIQELQAADQHTDLGKLVLNDAQKTVFFEDPAMQLDVGAVAKGYAAEVVAQEMLKGPMPSFIINAGGNVRTGHPPRDGRPNWGVAVQDPDGYVSGDGVSDVLDILFLHDTSVVTSGDYQRYFEYQGKRYHHIISPVTLMPTDFFRSVSIVTESSAYADLLSTCLFLMPYEEGRVFVESLEGVEALWILNDRSIRMTDGLKDKASSQGASNPNPNQ